MAALAPGQAGATPAPMPIPVAVLGATGYAGEIAIRILLGHPGFRIVHAGSDRLGGTRLADAVPTFLGETDLVLAADTPEAIIASGAQAVVLAKKSPEVTKVVPALLAGGLKLVDIGAEFRLRSAESYQKWYKEAHACPELLPTAVYGLSETHTDAIRAARVVGNPGCYATSMLLPLIPLLRERLIAAPVVAIGYSGVSGAGKKFVESNNNLFYALNENLHSYKPVGHQHTGEVDQELTTAAGSPVHCTFVPHLAPITRGIHTTITVQLADGASEAAVRACWQRAYAGRPFVRLRAGPKDVEVGNVAGTNFADLACAADGRTLIIASAIDNLVKGAAGQAVQNLNLMFGLDETAGLLRRGI
jgi:N-acetyl-gamma-glutamyl-phosphate reductase